MRTDARLQRLQPRFGESRRERLDQQVEVAEQRGREHCREQRAARGCPRHLLRAGDHAVVDRRERRDEHDDRTAAAEIGQAAELA